MANRFTDDPIDPGAARENVGAVEMLHLVQGNLASGGGLSDRRVSQRTSLAQREDSRGQSDISHGNSDETSRITRQTQEPDTVVDGPRFGRDLYSIDTTVGRRIHCSRQIRGALKIVDGKQNTRRHGIFPNGLAGKFAQSFQFKIAPLATGFAGLNQPVEFAVNATGKLASTLAAAAGREEGGIPRLTLSQPFEESPTLRITSQPIEAQFDGGGLP